MSDHNIFYCLSEGKFYTEADMVRCDKLPTGLIQVSQEEHLELLRGLAHGRHIVYEGGKLHMLPTRRRSESYQFLRDSLLTTASTILHHKAVELGYTSVDEVISFAEEPSDEQFQTEGRAFRFWRSQVRRECLNIAEKLFASDGMLPRTHQLEGMLPKFSLVTPHSPKT